MVVGVRMLVASFGARLVRPDPFLDFGHILAMLPDVTRVLQQLVAELLLYMPPADRKPRDAVDDVDREMISIEPVEHDHIERRRRGALLFETVNMHLGMIGAIIGETMNQIGIAVIGKDNRPVAREHAVEIAVADTVRMLIPG